MNDIEIALEDLDTLVEIARQHTGIASWLGLIQSALIMKEALEKQLPKAPLFEDNGGYPEYFEHWLACPVCDEAIPEYTSENETECCCLNCGQKLKWED